MTLTGKASPSQQARYGQNDVEFEGICGYFIFTFSSPHLNCRISHPISTLIFGVMIFSPNVYSKGWLISNRNLNVDWNLIIDVDLMSFQQLIGSWLTSIACWDMTIYKIFIMSYSSWMFMFNYTHLFMSLFLTAVISNTSNDLWAEYSCIPRKTNC